MARTYVVVDNAVGKISVAEMPVAEEFAATECVAKAVQFVATRGVVTARDAMQMELAHTATLANRVLVQTVQKKCAVL